MFKGNVDSPIMRALARVFDMMLLNVLFIVTSLPVITIGASLCGLHYVLLRMARNEEGYIIQSYFKAFKDNFRQATIAWLVYLVIGVALYADYRVMDRLPEDIKHVSGGLLLVILAVVLCSFVYFFPFLSRFENTIKGTLKNTFVVAIVYFVRTILMVAILIVFAYAYYNLPLRATPILLLFGASLPGILMAYIYTPILKKMEGL